MKFSLKRFGSLIRLFFQQHWKSIAVYFTIYTLALLAMSSFTWIITKGDAIGNTNKGDHNIFFLLMDFFTFSMSCFGAFIILQYIFKKQFHTTNSTIHYFQIPASTFEKWLFDTLVIGIGFTAISVSLLYVAQQVLFNNILLTNDNPIEVKGIFKNVDFLKFMILFMILSIATICTDYLKNDSKKWNWRSVGLLIMIIMFPVNWFFDWIFFKSDPITGDTWTRIPFQGVSINNPLEKYENYSVEHVWTLDQMFWYIGLPTLLIVWGIHYFKLKEYEI